MFLLIKFYPKRTFFQEQTLKSLVPPQKIAEVRRKSLENVIYNFWELPWLCLNKKIKLNQSEFNLQKTDGVMQIINKQPVLFIAGHLGAWDVLPAFLTLQGYIGNCIYRKGRQKWMENLLQIRNKLPPFCGFPADLHAVGEIMRVFRKNKFSYILIDQVPKLGAGEWVEFFGKKAYTMILAAKLSQQNYRNFDKHGYDIYLDDITDSLQGDIKQRMITINQHLERTITNHPQDYLWDYKRYREPRK